MTRKEAKERATEVLAAITDVNVHTGYQFTQPLMSAKDRVAQALIQAHNDAIDEAVTFLDARATKWAMDHTIQGSSGAKRQGIILASTLIEALKIGAPE